MNRKAFFSRLVAYIGVGVVAGPPAKAQVPEFRNGVCPVCKTEAPAIYHNVQPVLTAAEKANKDKWIKQYSGPYAEGSPAPPVCSALNRSGSRVFTALDPYRDHIEVPMQRVVTCAHCQAAFNQYSLPNDERPEVEPAWHEQK